MQTLSLNLLAKGPEGEPLPPVFPGLDLWGANPRRGQLTLIAAASGVGKSSLVTYMSMNMEDYDGLVPTLYFSADSDVTTFGIRAATMASTGLTTRDVETLLHSKQAEVIERLDDRTGHIWVCFDSSPSCKDLQDEIDAYAMVQGDYPKLIIIDNLMDIQTGMEERQGQDAVLDYLKQMAGKTQAAVIVLCHVVATGRGYDEDGKQIILDYASGKHPIPLSGLMNKIDKRPRLILTLYEASENTLGVCIVKNNNGRRDAEGNLRVYIPWVKEYMNLLPGRA